MTLTTAQLTSLIGAYLWPFMRIGAMLTAAPVFSARHVVPPRLRLLLTIAITGAIAPMLPPPPAVEPLSAAGLLISLNQLVLGAAMGFILQMVFSMLVVAGQTVSMTMGLGFATMVDPTNGVTVPVLSTFFTVLGTLLFLVMDGHLVAIQIVVESFRSMPVGTVGVSDHMLMTLVLWGGRMFAGGLLLALPALVSVLLIQIAFGVISRAAPTMNLFAVGFPVTILAGLVVLTITLPNLLPQFTATLMNGFDLMQKLAVAGG